MKLFPHEPETISRIGRRLRRRELTCLDVLQICLDRIDEREDKIRAWVLVDREGAWVQAQALDAELKSGRDRGPLHGMPIGVKDIIDVLGWPTECGSPRVSGVTAAADAAIVGRLREAGAVILGKTVTTAYAYLDPPPTRNPWNLDRTPGGSSSGSAAAVAAGMCLAAVGTQTGGSITRPAAFCGAAGLKPTYGSVKTRGIFPLAPSLDHAGVIARSVDDLLLVYQVIRDPDHRPGTEETRTRTLDTSQPRLVRLGGLFDRKSDAEMRSAIEAFLEPCKARNAEVIELIDPVDFEALLQDHRTIMAAEVAAVHRDGIAARPDAYPLRITELIREGEAISSANVEVARRSKPCWVERVLSLFGECDALVAPAAVGPAPDVSTTGDAVFNSPWSFLGFPSVSFPIGFSADGLPLAVQLIGRPGQDLDLLATSAWCEKVARSTH